MFDLGPMFMSSFQNAQQIAQTTGMIKAFDQSSLGETSKVAAKSANAEYLEKIGPIIEKQREACDAAEAKLSAAQQAKKPTKWLETLFEAEQTRLARLLGS